MTRTNQGFRLTDIQAHFRTRPEFPRNMANKYNGWRTRCLEEALEHVRTQHTKLTVSQQGKTKQFMQELHAAARKAGAMIREKKENETLEISFG